MSEAIEIHDLWNDPFFRIPNAIIDKHELDPYELTTLTVLRRFANGNNKKQAWPSLNKIAELSNVSREKVRRSIRSLIEKGYLIKENRFDNSGSKMSNVYTLVNPSKGGPQDSLPLYHEVAEGIPPRSLPLYHEVAIKKNYLDKEQEIKKKEKDIVVEVVNHLNVAAETNYKPTTKKTKTLIHARLAEGFSKNDFVAVIDKKCRQWKNDSKMCKYLRPETLFGTKFESYLNEKGGGFSGKVGSDNQGDYSGILQF